MSDQIQKATERVLQELLRQYKRRPDWDDAKDVIEGIDCGALVKAALPIPAEPRPDPVAALREKIEAEIARLWGIALEKAKGSDVEHAESMAMLRNVSALEWALALMAEPGGDAAGGGYCGNPPHVGNPGLVTGHATPVQFGCICPGDATPYCRNPLCPRKGPPDPLAPVERPSIL